MAWKDAPDRYGPKSVPNRAERADKSTLKGQANIWTQGVRKLSRAASLLPLTIEDDMSSRDYQGKREYGPY